jgi:hypothetical protein
MSLLNLTNDGLPNVLVVIFGAVARARAPLTRDELLELVAPPVVAHEDGKMARQTLARWLELGLFKLEGDHLLLSEAPDTDLRTDEDLLTAVRNAARLFVMSPANNPDLWASEFARAADLTRSLSWLLTQDIYKTRFRDLENLELAQIGDTGGRLMQNDTRRNGLQFWSHFLGFVRQPGGGDIDPTVAVREVLPRCLPRGQDMSAESFVKRLAEVLPVLDGGVFRRAVESHLRAGSIPTLSEGQLSQSLSRALLNLMLSEEILLEKKADTGSGIVLTGRDGLLANHRYQWVRRPKERRA